jgi:hypothetical protein
MVDGRPVPAAPAGDLDQVMNGRQDFDAAGAAGRSRSLAVLRKRPEIDDEAVPGRDCDRLECPDRGLGPAELYRAILP